MPGEPRLIDLMFEAHARARKAGRLHGTRSEQFAAAIDEVDRLRLIYEEERLCRRPPPMRKPPVEEASPRATWLRGEVSRTRVWRRG